MIKNLIFIHIISIYHKSILSDGKGETEDKEISGF